MSNGWTDERRARQAALIGTWRPWAKSTGPRTTVGKSVVSKNAFKGARRPERRKLRLEVRQLWAQIEAIEREECEMQHFFAECLRKGRDPLAEATALATRARHPHGRAISSADCGPARASGSAGQRAPATLKK